MATNNEAHLLDAGMLRHGVSQLRVAEEESRSVKRRPWLREVALPSLTQPLDMQVYVSYNRENSRQVDEKWAR